MSKDGFKGLLLNLIDKIESELPNAEVEIVVEIRAEEDAQSSVQKIDKVLDWPSEQPGDVARRVTVVAL